jgi:hypothetical protein
MRNKPEASPIASGERLFSLLPNVGSKCSSQLSSIFGDISDMADIWDTRFSRNDPVKNIQLYEKGCTALARRLADLPAKEDTPGSLYESCRIATLIYACRGAQKGSEIAALQGVTLKSLQKAIETTDFIGYWGQYVGALLWCFLVGSSEPGNRGNMDIHWFRARLMRATNGVVLVGSSGGLHSLQVFSWLIKCGQAKTLLER